MRSEYAWVPAGDFAKGRAAILRGFLRRGRIYRTRPMRLCLEARARRNVREECHLLERSQ